MALVGVWLLHALHAYQVKLHLAFLAGLANLKVGLWLPACEQFLRSATLGKRQRSVQAIHLVVRLSE